MAIAALPRAPRNLVAVGFVAILVVVLAAPRSAPITPASNGTFGPARPIDGPLGDLKRGTAARPVAFGSRRALR